MKVTFWIPHLILMLQVMDSEAETVNEDAKEESSEKPAEPEPKPSTEVEVPDTESEPMGMCILNQNFQQTIIIILLIPALRI